MENQMTERKSYCDHCGKEIGRERYSYTELPIDINSENAGGSAIVCEDCFIWIENSCGVTEID